MTTRLIIVRHGNTFTSEDTPTRVGAKTDLPLVESKKAEKVALYLNSQEIKPDIIFTSPLLRTFQTASIINDNLLLPIDIMTNDDFIEIDYGPDENKTEPEVQMRIGMVLSKQQGIGANTDDDFLDLGKKSIKDWDYNAILPPGWDVDVDVIKRTWVELSDYIKASHVNKTIVVVSSNGIIRFAPSILPSHKKKIFVENNSLKVSTGSMSMFELSNIDNNWSNTNWNFIP